MEARVDEIRREIFRVRAALSLVCQNKSHIVCSEQIQKILIEKALVAKLERMSHRKIAVGFGPCTAFHLGSVFFRQPLRRPRIMGQEL